MFLVRRCYAQYFLIANSRIIDDDRRLNAQRFEETFYSGKDSGNTETAPAAEAAAMVAPEQGDARKETDQEALIRILKNPEMAALLKTLAQSL